MVDLPGRGGYGCARNAAAFEFQEPNFSQSLSEKNSLMSLVPDLRRVLAVGKGRSERWFTHSNPKIKIRKEGKENGINWLS